MKNFSLRIVLGFLALLQVLNPLGSAWASAKIVRSPASGWELALAEFQYALSVEWNQEDPAFLEEAVGRFVEQVESLRGDGMASEELARSLGTEVLGERATRSLSRISEAARSEKLSPTQARALILEALPRDSAEGARWSGTATVAVIGTVVVALVVGALLLERGLKVGDYNPKSCEWDPVRAEYVCVF